MKNITYGEITQNKNIAPNIYDMRLYAPGLFENGRPLPGQFVMLYTGKGEHLLPRPISIAESFPETGAIRLVYQTAGQGTAHFASLSMGRRLHINGPLGNGYTINSKADTHFLIGGGIGIPPLLALAKVLPAQKTTAVLGFRETPYLANDFEPYCREVHIATDSGAAGFHGNAVLLLENIFKEYHTLPGAAYQLYACGPSALLSALCAWAGGHGLPVQISAEERMACGIGACVGCAIKIKNDGGHVYRRVCKDGPVFEGGQVIW